MRVILADHHPHALWALKTMFQEKPEFEVIGEAMSAGELLSLTAEYSPDLTLIDWELPGLAIETLIHDLHAHTPRPTVIVMSSKPEYGRMLLKAGADAFISKADQADWLLETLHKFETTQQDKKE